MRFLFRREPRSQVWFRLQAVLVIAGLGLVLIAQPAVAHDAASTPSATATPGVIGTPPATSTCDATATPDASTIATTYAIANGSSNAQYEAEEQLAGKGANTAIGKTNAFIGSFSFDKSGNPIACSRWYVDLRTLKSDEARRDNFLYSNTLETETYPLATFTLTSVEGFTGPLVEGKEMSLTLIGELNLHGVTKMVSWSAKVTLNGDEITGAADTSFDMPDFNIQPPKVGPVLSLDEHVKLHVDIVAKKS
jgi:polyisoprenoid-binding protein YceI